MNRDELLVHVGRSNGGQQTDDNNNNEKHLNKSNNSNNISNNNDDYDDDIKNQEANGINLDDDSIGQLVLNVDFAPARESLLQLLAGGDQQLPVSSAASTGAGHLLLPSAAAQSKREPNVQQPTSSHLIEVSLCIKQQQKQQPTPQLRAVAIKDKPEEDNIELAAAAAPLVPSDSQVQRRPESLLAPAGGQRRRRLPDEEEEEPELQAGCKKRRLIYEPIDRFVLDVAQQQPHRFPPRGRPPSPPVVLPFKSGSLDACFCFNLLNVRIEAGSCARTTMIRQPAVSPTSARESHELWLKSEQLTSELRLTLLNELSRVVKSKGKIMITVFAYECQKQNKQQQSNGKQQDRSNRKRREKVSGGHSLKSLPSSRLPKQQQQQVAMGADNELDSSGSSRSSEDEHYYFSQGPHKHEPPNSGLELDEDQRVDSDNEQVGDSCCPRCRLEWLQRRRGSGSCGRPLAATRSCPVNRRQLSDGQQKGEGRGFHETLTELRVFVEPQMDADSMTCDTIQRLIERTQREQQQKPQLKNKPQVRAVSGDEQQQRKSASILSRRYSAALWRAVSGQTSADEQPKLQELINCDLLSDAAKRLGRRISLDGGSLLGRLFSASSVQPQQPTSGASGSQPQDEAISERRNPAATCDIRLEAAENDGGDSRNKTASHLTGELDPMSLFQGEEFAKRHRQSIAVQTFFTKSIECNLDEEEEDENERARGSARQQINYYGQEAEGTNNNNAPLSDNSGEESDVSSRSDSSDEGDSTTSGWTAPTSQGTNLESAASASRQSNRSNRSGSRRAFSGESSAALRPADGTSVENYAGINQQTSGDYLPPPSEMDCGSRNNSGSLIMKPDDDKAEMMSDDYGLWQTNSEGANRLMMQQKAAHRLTPEASGRNSNRSHDDLRMTRGARDNDTSMLRAQSSQTDSSYVEDLNQLQQQNQLELELNKLNRVDSDFTLITSTATTTNNSMSGPQRQHSRYHKQKDANSIMSDGDNKNNALGPSKTTEARTTTSSINTTTNTSATTTTTTTGSASGGAGGVKLNQSISRRQVVKRLLELGADPLDISLQQQQQRRAFSETEAYAAGGYPSTSGAQPEHKDPLHLLSYYHSLPIGSGKRELQGGLSGLLSNNNQLEGPMASGLFPVAAPLGSRQIKSAEPINLNSLQLTSSQNTTTSSSNSVNRRNKDERQRKRYHAHRFEYRPSEEGAPIGGSGRGDLLRHQSQQLSGGSGGRQQLAVGATGGATGNSSTSATGSTTNSDHHSDKHHNSLTNLIDTRHTIGQRNYQPLGDNKQAAALHLQLQQQAQHPEPPTNKQLQQQVTGKAASTAVATMVKHQQLQWRQSNTFSSSLNSDISTSGGPKDTTDKDSSRRTSTLSGISSIYQQEISLNLATPHSSSNYAQGVGASSNQMGSIPELADFGQDLHPQQLPVSSSGLQRAQLHPSPVDGLQAPTARGVDYKPEVGGGQRDSQSLGEETEAEEEEAAKAKAGEIETETAAVGAQRDQPEQAAAGSMNLQKVAQSLGSQLRERLRPLNALMGISQEPAVVVRETGSSSNLAPLHEDEQQPPQTGGGGHLYGRVEEDGTFSGNPASGSRSQPATPLNRRRFNNTAAHNPLVTSASNLQAADRANRTETQTPASFRSFFRSTSSAAFSAFASSFQLPSSSSTLTGATVLQAQNNHWSSMSSQQFCSESMGSVDKGDVFAESPLPMDPSSAQQSVRQSTSTGADEPQPSPGAGFAPTQTPAILKSRPPSAAAGGGLRSPLSPISVTSTRFFARIRDKFSLSPASHQQQQTATDAVAASPLVSEATTPGSSAQVEPAPPLTGASCCLARPASSMSNTNSTSTSLNTATTAICKRLPPREAAERPAQSSRFAAAKQEASDRCKAEPEQHTKAAPRAGKSSLSPSPSCSSASSSHLAIDVVDYDYDHVLSSRRPSVQRQLDEQVNQVYRMTVERKLQSSPRSADGFFAELDKAIEAASGAGCSIAPEQQRAATSGRLAAPAGGAHQPPAPPPTTPVAACNFPAAGARVAGGSDLESIISSSVGCWQKSHAAPGASIYQPLAQGYYPVGEAVYAPNGSGHQPPGYASSGQQAPPLGDRCMDSMSIDSSSSARSLRSCWFSMPELYAMNRADSSSQSPSGWVQCPPQVTDQLPQDNSHSPLMDELLGALSSRLNLTTTTATSGGGSRALGQSGGQCVQQRPVEWPSRQLYEKVNSGDTQNWTLSDLDLTGDDIVAAGDLGPLADLHRGVAQRVARQVTQDSPAKTMAAANRQPVRDNIQFQAGDYQMVKCSTLDDSVCASIKSGSSTKEQANAGELTDIAKGGEEPEVDQETQQPESRPTSQNSTISNTSCALSDLNSSDLQDIRSSPTSQNLETTTTDDRSASVSPLNVSLASAGSGQKQGLNLAPLSLSPIPQCTITADPANEAPRQPEETGSRGGGSGGLAELSAGLLAAKQRAMSLVPTVERSHSPSGASLGLPEVGASGQLPAGPRRRSAMGNLMRTGDMAPAAATLDLRLAGRKNRVKLTDLHPVTFLNDREFLNSMSSLKKAGNNKLDAIFNSPVGRRLSVNAELAAQNQATSPQGAKSGIKIGLTGYVYFDPHGQRSAAGSNNLASQFRRPSLAPNFWRAKQQQYGSDGLSPSPESAAAATAGDRANSTSGHNLLTVGEALRSRPRAASCTPSSFLRAETGSLLATSGASSPEPPKASKLVALEPRPPAPIVATRVQSSARPRDCGGSRRQSQMGATGTQQVGYNPDKRRSTMALLERLSESSIELLSDGYHNSQAYGSSSTISSAGSGGGSSSGSGAGQIPTSGAHLSLESRPSRRSISCLLKIGEDEELKAICDSHHGFRQQLPVSPQKTYRSPSPSSSSDCEQPAAAANDEDRDRSEDEDSSLEDCGQNNSSSSSSDDGDIDKLVAQYSVVGDSMMAAANSGQMRRRPPGQRGPRQSPQHQLRASNFGGPNSEQVVKNDMIMRQLLLATNVAALESSGRLRPAERQHMRRFSAINLYQRDEDLFVANSMKRPPASQLQVLSTLPLLAGTLPILAPSQQKQVSAAVESATWNRASCNMLPVLPSPRAGVKSIITGHSGLNLQPSAPTTQMNQRAVSEAEPEVDVEEQLRRLRLQEKRSVGAARARSTDHNSQPTPRPTHEVAAGCSDLSIDDVQVPSKLTIPAILQPPESQLKQLDEMKPAAKAGSEDAERKSQGTVNELADEPNILLPVSTNNNNGSSGSSRSPRSSPQPPKLLSPLRSPPHSPTKPLIQGSPSALSPTPTSPPSALLIGGRNDPLGYSGSKSCEPFKQLDTIIEGRGLLLGAEQQANPDYANRLRRLSGNHSRRSSLGNGNSQASDGGDWCKCDPSPARRRSSARLQEAGSGTSLSLPKVSVEVTEASPSKGTSGGQQQDSDQDRGPSLSSSSMFVFNTMRSLARRTLNNFTTQFSGPTNQQQQPEVRPADLPARPNQRQQRSSSMVATGSSFRAGSEPQQPTLPSRLLREKVKQQQEQREAALLRKGGLLSMDVDRRRRDTGEQNQVLAARKPEAAKVTSALLSPNCSSSASEWSVTGSADEEEEEDSSLMSLDDAENYLAKNKDNKMKEGRSLELSSSEEDIRAPSSSSTSSNDTISSACKNPQLDEPAPGEQLLKSSRQAEPEVEEEEEEEVADDEEEEEVEEPKVCYKCNKKIRMEVATSSAGGYYYDGSGRRHYNDDYDEEAQNTEEDFEDEEYDDEEEEVEENDKQTDATTGKSANLTQSPNSSKETIQRIPYQPVGQQQHKQLSRSGARRHNSTATRRSASMNTADSELSASASGGHHINRRKNKWHIQRNLAPKLKRQRSFSANYAPEVPNPMMPPPRRFSAAPTLTCPHRNKSSSHSSSSLHHTYSIDSSESMITVIPANRGQEFKRASRGSPSAITAAGGYGFGPGMDSHAGSFYALPRSPRSPLSPRSPSRCSPGLLTPNASEPPPSPGTKLADVVAGIGGSVAAASATPDAQVVAGGSERPRELYPAAAADQQPPEGGETCPCLPSSKSDENLIQTNIEIEDESRQPEVEETRHLESTSSTRGCVNVVVGGHEANEPIVCETINDLCARHSKQELEYLIAQIRYLKISDCYFSERSSTLCMVIEVQEKWTRLD